MSATTPTTIQVVKTTAPTTTSAATASAGTAVDVAPGTEVGQLLQRRLFISIHQSSMFDYYSSSNRSHGHMAISASSSQCSRFLIPARATSPPSRDLQYWSFWRSTAAVPTDLHGISRSCSRYFTDNRGHSTGYREPSTDFLGYSTGIHGMPRQVAEHRRGPWH